MRLPRFVLPTLQESLGDLMNRTEFHSRLGKLVQDPSAAAVQGVAPEVAAPAQPEARTSLMSKFLRKLSEGAQIYDIVKNVDTDLTTKAWLIAQVHDLHAIRLPGLRQLARWGARPGEDQAVLGDLQPVPQLRRQERSQRLLLVVHGTFSSSGLFLAQFHEDARAAIDRTYANVLCYDHYSLTLDPAQNGRDLYERLTEYLADWPEAEVDIICHSRGGLVVRELVESNYLAKQPPYRISRVHFVATPNNGTKFASPSRIVQFLDEHKQLAVKASRFIYTPSFGELLEQLDTVEEADMVLKAIPGLQAMNPESAYIKQLNDGMPEAELARYPACSAACADYEPDGEEHEKLTLWEMLMGRVRHEHILRNAIMEAIFEGPNDLTVDTTSVLQIHDRLATRLLPPTEVIAFGHPRRWPELLEYHPDFRYALRINRGDVEHSTIATTPEWASWVAHKLQMN